MADEPVTHPEPDLPPADDTPQWAKDLQRVITELPGKLRATITDEDRTGLAQAVHGLFESSGAFEARETQHPADDEATTPETTETDETPPKKAGKLSGFAAWFSGER